MSRFAAGLTLPILAATVIVAGCSSPSPSQKEPGTSHSISSSGSSLMVPTNGLVQYSREGAVTIDVQWLGESNGSLAFDVAMNTHSVDLDQYDLGELSVLWDDEGREYRPTLWEAPQGGHHRSGTLTFPLPDSLSQGRARYLELSIRAVAEVKERVLKWELEAD